MSVLIDANNNSREIARADAITRLESVPLPDGTRVDAREMARGDFKPFNERMREHTERRHGGSNTLREMETLARMTPQSRMDENVGVIALGAKKIRDLLISDAAVELTGQKEGEAPKKTKFPSLRAVASYLVDGMSLLKVGSEIKIIKAGSKEDNKGRNINNTIVVNEGRYNEYLRLWKSKTGKEDVSNSIRLTLSQNLEPELLTAFLTDKFNIPRDNNVRIIKESGNNSSEGMFYWHDGYLKIDSKIFEKPETGISRLDVGRVLVKQLMKALRAQDTHAVETKTMGPESDSELKATSYIDRLRGQLDRLGAVIKNRVVLPFLQNEQLQRRIGGASVDARNLVIGDQLNELSAKGSLKMIEDKVLLTVLRHIYHKDFEDIEGSTDINYFDNKELNSAAVIDVIGRILVAQEITRVVFEYTLGAVDIIHSKKEVSSYFDEKRKAEVAKLIKEFGDVYSTVETTVSGTEVALPDSLASTRVTALTTLLSSCWEIATVNNTLNKESGDWEEAAKAISELVRDDTHEQSKLFPNIQRVYNAINALAFPGISGDSVMESYYWNLGYKVVAQSEGKKFRLVPRIAKFRDRKGIERTYEVSTNYNLLRNCVGFFNGSEVETIGRFQVAKRIHGEQNVNSDTKLSEADLDNFLPENLDKEKIDRETPIILPVSNSFSAASTLSFISFNAGIAICTFDGAGRARDTGEDVFANEITSTQMSYSKFTRDGHEGTSNYTNLRGWKRLIEVFQPGMGFIWGAQQFFDVDTGKEMAIGTNRTGRKLVPLASLGTTDNVVGRDIFIPANYKYYAYDKDGNFCVQVFNRDFATRINTVVAALTKANTRIFGKLDEGFDGFATLMNERDSSIAGANGYHRLVANLVHKAFLGKLMDAVITSAKEASVVGDTVVKEGKVKNKVAEFIEIIQNTGTLDKLLKAMGGDANAVASLVAMLPSFAEDTVIKDIASSTNVARATVVDAVEAPGTVYENLLRGPLAMGDVFIGPVFSRIIDISSQFPSILSDGTGITVSAVPRTMVTTESRIIEAPDGVTRFNPVQPDSITRRDIQIDFGSGYQVAAEAMTKPDSGIIDLNKNLALGGLLSYLHWFGSNFRIMFDNVAVSADTRVYEKGEHQKEKLGGAERKTRLVTIRKALNEMILTYSMFFNPNRAVEGGVDNYKNLGNSTSRFVRDFVGYTIKEYVDSEEANYPEFIEGKLREMLDICLANLSASQQLKILETLNNKDKRFFTKNRAAGTFKNELISGIAFGEITGISTIDAAWERAMHNCLISFQAVGIAERLEILINEDFLRYIFQESIVDSETFVDINSLELRMRDLRDKRMLLRVRPVDKKIPNDKERYELEVRNSVEVAIEYLASRDKGYGLLIQSNARITSEVANIQAESKPATRDILGHIATRVQRISTAMPWGSFFMAFCPTLDKVNEEGGLDYTTSPGLLFLRQLRLRDASLRDAYNGISANLNLALLEDGQLMDGFGRELKPELRRSYPSNIFKPSALRIQLMTDPTTLPRYPMEVRSREYRDRLLTTYRRSDWFNKATEEQQAEIIEAHTNFLFTVANDRALVLTKGQPVRMAPIISSVFEEGISVVSDLAPFYPAVQAVLLGGELPLPERTLRPEDLYSSVNVRLDDTVDGLGYDILNDVGLEANMEKQFYGLDSKIGKLKIGLEWLMLGARHVNREPSPLGYNSSVLRTVSGEQDPIYFLQRKKALEESVTGTDKKIRENINIVTLIDMLPKVVANIIKTIGLSIEDFGLSNVVAHGLAGATLVAPYAVAFSTIVLAGPVVSIVITATGAILFPILGGSLSNKIERSLANRDTKTKRLAQGIVSSTNVAIGNPISEQEHIWSSTVAKWRNIELAKSVANNFDWEKGVPKPTSKFVRSVGIFFTLLPEIPIVGPILKLVYDSNDTSSRVAKYMVVSALTTMGGGIALGGSIGFVPGLAVGALIGGYSAIKNLRSLDRTLPLVTTDLPSTEKSSVSGKKVKKVLLTFLNIKKDK